MKDKLRYIGYLLREPYFWMFMGLVILVGFLILLFFVSAYQVGFVLTHPDSIGRFFGEIANGFNSVKLK